MAPKLYGRVQRFHAVLQTLRDVDWTEIAADCGYFDHANFIQSLPSQVFPPAQYHALKAPDLNHVARPGQGPFSTIAARTEVVPLT